MFEHVPLRRIQWSVPGTPKNSSRQLSTADFHLLQDNIASDADFLLDGSQASLQCIPVSEYARTHLLYIQAFSILYSEDRYYTIRRNFNSHLLLYTLSGNGILEYGSEIIHLEPYTGFWIDCRKLHSYRTEGDHWTHADLHFDGSTASHLLKIYQRYGGSAFKDSPNSSFISSLDKMLTEYSHSIAPYREDATSCRLQELLLDLIRQNKEQPDNSPAVPDTIRYLVKYMENNYSRRLTLDFLAEFACLSKYHLSREFKRWMGTSPINYLINLRITAAQQMLVDGNERINVIAEETGFNNINNFNRQFRERTHMTPAEYRAKYRQ